MFTYVILHIFMYFPYLPTLGQVLFGALGRCYLHTVSPEPVQPRGFDAPGVEMNASTMAARKQKANLSGTMQKNQTIHEDGETHCKEILRAPPPCRH